MRAAEVSFCALGLRWGSRKTRGPVPSYDVHRAGLGESHLRGREAGHVATCRWKVGADARVVPWSGTWSQEVAQGRAWAEFLAARAQWALSFVPLDRDMLPGLWERLIAEIRSAHLPFRDHRTWFREVNVQGSRCTSRLATVGLGRLDYQVARWGLESEVEAG